MNMLKVLLVDDDCNIRTGMKMLLDWDKYGFCLQDEVEDGIKALEYLEKQPVDLIITDIKMPFIDGIEFIKKVRLLSDVEVIILSGYSDFKYAQKALEYGVKYYLVKPIEESELIQCLIYIRKKISEKEEVKNILGHSSLIVKEKILEDLLFNPNDISRYGIDIKDLGLDSRFTRFCVLAVKIYGGSVKKVLNKTDPFNGIQEILGKTRQEGVRAYIAIRNGTLYILCCSDSKNTSYSKGIAGRILEFLKHDACDFILGIGVSVQNLKQAIESARSAETAVDYGYFTGLNRIIDAESIDSKTGPACFMWEDSELISSIKRFDHHAMNQAIDRLFKNLKENCTSSRIVKTIIINLVFKLSSLLSQQGSAMSAIYGEKTDLQDQVFNEKTIFTVQKWFEAICGDILNHLVKIKCTKNYDIARKAKDFIDENFLNDIYLRDIARMLYFSPDYIGKVFKDTSGFSFNEYLTKKRIDHAKELLAYSNESIANISVIVKFRCTDYFTRLFKKTEGMTPNEYRKHFLSDIQTKETKFSNST